jgi:hypothetical protein
MSSILFCVGNESSGLDHDRLLTDARLARQWEIEIMSDLYTAKPFRGQTLMLAIGGLGPTLAAVPRHELAFLAEARRYDGECARRAMFSPDSILRSVHDRAPTADEDHPGMLDGALDEEVDGKRGAILWGFSLGLLVVALALVFK